MVMEIIYENILGRFLLSSSVENQLAPVSFFFFFFFLFTRVIVLILFSPLVQNQMAIGYLDGVCISELQ